MVSTPLSAVLQLKRDVSPEPHFKVQATRHLRTATSLKFFVEKLACQGPSGANEASKFSTVDHKATKGVPILVIDLNSPAQCKLFEELLEPRETFALRAFCTSMRYCINGAMYQAAQSETRAGSHIAVCDTPWACPHCRLGARERVGKGKSLVPADGQVHPQVGQASTLAGQLKNPSSSLMWVTTPFIEAYGPPRHKVPWLFVSTTACLALGAKS